MNWGRDVSVSFLLHFVFVGSGFIFFSFHAPKMRVETQIGVHEIQVFSSAKPEVSVSAPSAPSQAPSPMRPQHAGATVLSKSFSKPAGSPGKPGIGADYLKTIMQMILSHQNYPKVSILNEEEGVVQVQVVLDGQGQIENLRVDHTSGFERLDDAALSTLRSIRQFPLPTNAKGSVSLMIPIRFEINSSKHSFRR